MTLILTQSVLFVNLRISNCSLTFMFLCYFFVLFICFSRSPYVHYFFTFSFFKANFTIHSTHLRVIKINWQFSITATITLKCIATLSILWNDFYTLLYTFARSIDVHFVTFHFKIIGKKQKKWKKLNCVSFCAYFQMNKMYVRLYHIIWNPLFLSVSLLLSPLNIRINFMLFSCFNKIYIFYFTFIPYHFLHILH